MTFNLIKLFFEGFHEFIKSIRRSYIVTQCKLVEPPKSEEKIKLIYEAVEKREKT
jgi:hypothetical protein